MFEIVTNGAEETQAAGYSLGRVLRQGDIICLKGELGTGKTVFTGGVAMAMGIHDYITSPTFNIVNEYKGRIPLYHFDVYRINDPDEMFEIGFEEYLESSGIVVIEWAELIDEIIPAHHIAVEIKKDIQDHVDKRIITIKFEDERRLPEGWRAL